MPSRPDMPALRRDDLAADPIAQLSAWYEEASESVPLADAMTLSTIGPGGAPDARMVLLKGFDRRGLRFFTNEHSVKGAQLAARPEAALTIFWRELDRQVRVRGAVSRLDEHESDEYFASRPRDSQIGAWASPQSAPIADRAELDARVGEIERRYEGAEVPRPEHWGGYVVALGSIEFWQGQKGRLHDRFAYRPTASGWEIERLAP